MGDVVDVAFYTGLGVMGYAHGGTFLAGTLIFSASLTLAVLSSTDDSET